MRHHSLCYAHLDVFWQISAKKHSTENNIECYVMLWDYFLTVFSKYFTESKAKYDAKSKVSRDVSQQEFDKKVR